MQKSKTESNSTGAHTEVIPYSFEIAVFLCIISAFFSNLGSNVQKLSYDANTVTSHPHLWSIGLGSIILGACLDFAALGLGAQSIVAPLGSLTLVFNLILANIIHGEKATKKDVQATAFIIAGCVICVITSGHTTKVLLVHDLLLAFKSLRFTIYMTLVVAISSLLFAAIYFFEQQRRKSYETYEDYYEKYHRIALPVLSGVIGAQSVLFAKALDEMLISTLSDPPKASGFNNYFYDHAGFFFVLLCLIFCSITQLYLQNRSLKKWTALFVIPTFQSSWILFSVLGGGVFYNEFTSFSFVQGLIFLVGIWMTISGVLKLSKTQKMEAENEYLLSDKDSYSSYGSNGA